MKRSSTQPKVFISYSWSSPAHTDMVLTWAERLVVDGVDVTLDRWDLKEGTDKYAFMERMVTDASISKVLMFVDARYTEKADKRRGGVGTESQIISKEIYDKVDQQKFIPIVCEYKNGEPCLPVFLRSRLFFDFSVPRKREESYDKLLRLLLDRPLYVKPPLGKPPAHLVASRPSKTAPHIGVRGRESLASLGLTYVSTGAERIGAFQELVRRARKRILIIGVGMTNLSKYARSSLGELAHAVDIDLLMIDPLFLERAPELAQSVEEFLDIPGFTHEARQSFIRLKTFCSDWNRKHPSKRQFRLRVYRTLPTLSMVVIDASAKTGEIVAEVFVYRAGEYRPRLHVENIGGKDSLFYRLNVTGKQLWNSSRVII